jgi:serine/threonine protein kinase
MHTLTQVWKQLEGRLIEETFPLLQQLGGSEHDAVFLTERVSKGTQGTQRVAIKLLSAEGCFAGKQAEDAQLSRWSDVAKLSHPHLLRMFESGRCHIDGVRFLYVVTEYAEENLAQILPQRALSLDEVNELVPPTAEALAFLHRAGYVHSRIKPAKIMAVENQLKISTDCLRKTGERDERELSAYDAPEIASEGFSAAGDVWSIGVMLVAVLTQREPDTNRTEAGQIRIDDSIPEPFREIAQQCLRIDPRRRATITEIIGAFQAEASPAQRQGKLNADAVNGNATTRIGERESLQATKRPLLRGFVAALFLSAIVIAALVFAVWLGRKFVAQRRAIPLTPSPSTRRSTRGRTVDRENVVHRNSARQSAEASRTRSFPSRTKYDPWAGKGKRSSFSRPLGQCVSRAVFFSGTEQVFCETSAGGGAQLEIQPAPSAWPSDRE